MVQIEMRVHSESISFRERLKKWRVIEKRIPRLRAEIADLEEHLRRLREDLAEGDTARAIQYDKEPVQGGRLYDSTADYIADTYAEIERIEHQIAKLRRRLERDEIELRNIERAVEDLNEDHRTIIIMRYHDWCSWESIESKTGWSRASIYRKINEAVEAIDGFWRT